MSWIIWIIIFVIIYIIIRYFLNLKEKETKELKEKYHIKEGEIHYTDLDKPAKAIFSKKIRLVGKPDYIVEIGGIYIPVEVKKGSPDTPFQSHIMQLMAYCYLVEEKYKTKVPYGVLDYEGYQTKIPYTKLEKEKLLAVINVMRTQKEFKRNHNQKNKCDICGFGYFCEEKIK